MTRWWLELDEGEGRGDPFCLNASRTALCLAPLDQREGGIEYRHGLAFRVEPHDREPARRRRRTRRRMNFAAAARFVPVALVIVWLATTLFFDLLKGAQ
jgi:hypothetical protein